MLENKGATDDANNAPAYVFANATPLPRRQPRVQLQTRCTDKASLKTGSQIILLTLRLCSAMQLSCDCIPLQRDDSAIFNAASANYFGSRPAVPRPPSAPHPRLRDPSRAASRWEGPRPRRRRDPSLTANVPQIECGAEGRAHARLVIPPAKHLPRAAAVGSAQDDVHMGLEQREPEVVCVLASAIVHQSLRQPRVLHARAMRLCGTGPARRTTSSSRKQGPSASTGIPAAAGDRGQGPVGTVVNSGTAAAARTAGG